MGTSTERQRVSLWVSKSGHAALTHEAEKRGISIAQIYRENLAIGFKHYAAGERVKE